MDDTTALSYWLNWRFFLCALWVLISVIAAAILIEKYEVANKKRSGQQDDELDFETIGILYDDETWRTSLKSVHPVWLLAYRLIAFGVLLTILFFNLAISGAGVLFYYTQWTFVLVTFYFGLASSLSIYGCYQYWKKVGDNNINHADLATPLIEECLVSQHMPMKPINNGGIHFRKTAGIWGLFLSNSLPGAVGLTDSVFWFIIYPFLTPATYKLSYWILHACVSMRWPYIFLDLSSPYAPIWYLGVGLILFPAFGLFALIVKCKQLLLSKFSENPGARGKNTSLS